MTVPPSKPGNTARAALAARLTEMRAAAGLSGNALAKRMGVVQSRVWKIEHGTLLPAEEDIRAWARETGNEQEAEGLMAALAEARGEQAFSAVIRERGGAAFQDRVREVEVHATRIGEFAVAVVPGLLQTADYARELMSLPSGLRTWDDGEDALEAAVNARMRRQDVIHDPGKRVQVVLGEGALRTLVVSPQVLAGQLGKLLSVLRLPSVELGIIGFAQHMPAYPLGFRLYDSELAVTESAVAEQNYTMDSKPDEVAAYVEAFNELRQAASTGDNAEVIIRSALSDVRGIL